MLEGLSGIVYPSNLIVSSNNALISELKEIDKKETLFAMLQKIMDVQALFMKKKLEVKIVLRLSKPLIDQYGQLLKKLHFQVDDP